MVGLFGKGKEELKVFLTQKDEPKTLEQVLQELGPQRREAVLKRAQELLTEEKMRRRHSKLAAGDYSEDQ